jgi:hypothetical protein
VCAFGLTRNSFIYRLPSNSDAQPALTSLRRLIGPLPSIGHAQPALTSLLRLIGPLPTVGHAQPALTSLLRLIGPLPTVGHAQPALTSLLRLIGPVAYCWPCTPLLDITVTDLTRYATVRVCLRSPSKFFCNFMLFAICTSKCSKLCKNMYTVACRRVPTSNPL